MMALPQQALPLATTPAFTPRNALPAPDAAGWKQAMGQAQASPPDSPQHAATAGAGNAKSAGAAVPGSAAPATRPSAEGVALPRAGCGVHDAATRAAARFVLAEAAGSPAMPMTPIAGPGTPAAFREQPAPAREVPVPPPRRGDTAAAPPPLHVHVEQQADGLAVWLGIAGDEEAVAVRAAAVVDALRRSLRGPDRLAQVVCNGTALHTAPRVHKETP